MTNITQQEIIEEFEASIVNLSFYKKLFPTLRRGVEFNENGEVYPYAYDIANLMFEVWQAARSDDRQSGEAVAKTYWLIEKNTPAEYVLLNGAHEPIEFTNDVYKALKYERKKDAENLVEFYELNDVRICDHVFYEAAPQQAIPAIDVNKMVDRFLRWKLPSNFCPDAGISFSPEYNKEYMEKQGKPPMRHEPTGTNLFNAVQAKAMFEYVLNGITTIQCSQGANEAYEKVAKLLESKANNIAEARGVVDYSTNALEFSSHIAEDAYNSYMEDAEEIRTLMSAPSAPEATHTDMNDACRYRKLKELALNPQTFKSFAISKFNGTHWDSYEGGFMDLDKELDSIRALIPDTPAPNTSGVRDETK